MMKPDAIIRKLVEHGYEAYYVGGCVRDIILGRIANDWDITTSALPDQIMECFEHSVPTGIKHGTITVIEAEMQAEVTTYRTDGIYVDGRHPEKVSFGCDLAQDLARRDFTINAMAMDLNGRIVDLYGGREDLEQKQIRCVGDPDVRFSEDALRMMRALRFAAQLGFDIEMNTKLAIKRNAYLCEELSVERVRDEIEKILCSERTEYLDIMLEYGVLSRFGIGHGGDCSWLSDLPKETVSRWAGLCKTWPGLKLPEMRLSKQITKDAALAAQIEAPETIPEWKMLIAEHGERVGKIVATISRKEKMFEAILKSGECISLKQLAVHGDDFPMLSGAAVGFHLWKLMRHVAEHPEDNRENILKSIPCEIN